MSVSQYNKNNPTIKRIMKEIKEMNAEDSPYFTAQPLDDNIFEWHFTLRGPESSAFEGGIFHGKINLPLDYPFKPPNIQLLTPNGRFEIGTKICLTISAHHPETWQPSWSIRTVLVALMGFFPTEGKGAIGALDYSEKERRKLSAKSVAWKCPECGSQNATALPELPTAEPSNPSSSSGSASGPPVDAQAAAALQAMQAFAAEQKPAPAAPAPGEAASSAAASPTATAGAGVPSTSAGPSMRHRPASTAAAGAEGSNGAPAAATNANEVNAKKKKTRRRGEGPNTEWFGCLILLVMTLLAGLVLKRILW